MAREQVTIFDVIPNENQPDFKSMTLEEIIHQIEISTGLIFSKVEFFKSTAVYRAKSGEKEGCDIHLGEYSFEAKKGVPYIACDCWRQNGNEGCSRPCDSIEEVVDMIRKELLKKGGE